MKWISSLRQCFEPGWTLGYPLSHPPLPPASVSHLPLYVQKALRSQEEAVYAAIVARAINTLAPRGGSGVKAWLHSVSNQETTARGIPAYTCLTCLKKGPFDSQHCTDTFCPQLVKFKTPTKTTKVSLMLTDRQLREQEVARIVAELCQRDGLNGFLPLVNLFCNVLTFPQPPPPHPFFLQCLEVAETYIYLSVLLILVFLLGFVLIYN